MRIVRIPTLIADTPVGIDVQTYSATAVNFLTLPAGVMLVFDCGPEIGFLGQREMWWFCAVTVNSTLEVAVFSESH